MQKTQQIGAESKAQVVEQINLCLRSGDYSRALDLSRAAAAEFPSDADLSALEKLAHDGVKRNAEANRLITESQELFAQRKPADAIQLLRRAYELDKSNSLARAILANALVEHAHSLVETDWLKAETLTNQALALNPAHPTAKTILNRIVDQKVASSVEDWVSHARKLQSSGDLFAALAWVAEGLAVHPHDPKLLQIQDAIQRDQETRRRQARRGDLEEMRRLQHEIDGAADISAKQALAERIQALAAKHWTDGEILSVANALLLRLGLVPQKSSAGSPKSKGAAVIFHVPRPSRADAGQISPRRVPENNVAPSPVLPSPAAPNSVAPTPVSSGNLPVTGAPRSIVPQNQTSQNQISQNRVSRSQVARNDIASITVASSKAPPDTIPPINVQPNIVPPAEGSATPPAPPLLVPQAAAVSVAELRAPAKATAPSSKAKEPTAWNAITLMLVSSAAAIGLVAVMFFLARKHPAPPTANVPQAAPATAVSAPIASAPPVSAPEQTTHPETTPEKTSEPASPASSDRDGENVTRHEQPPAESGRNLGVLVVVAGQDGAKVFVNGKVQRQLTQAGQLRLPNLELKDYVVQVAKSGFQDPPQQKIRIRQGEEARLIFNLQPQTRLASLTLQGGAPGTAVFVDQTLAGTIRPDGTLSVSTVNPGDHTIELRKERFKPRQFKKHFVAGETVSLAAADAALEAAPGELTITFVPADARVAVVKGDILKIASSGVPLGLPAGIYTLTARSVDGFTSSSPLEVVAGQSRNLHLSLAPTGMSNWENPDAWKHEKDSFIRKGGDFVLYGAAPASGTFVFSGMIAKGHFLQWVLNYTDPKNYVLFQLDDNNFYRTVVRNGQKADVIKVPEKGDKKGFRTLHIRVSATELVHQIKHGDSWTVVDRWTQPGTNLSLGKFGFYIPSDDQVALSGFAHYADLNIR